MGELFFDRFPGICPSAEAAIQMDHLGEAKFFEGFQGAGASAASLAMDQGGLVFVELGQSGLKIIGGDVDVLRALDMAAFELVRGADIDDDDLALGDDFGGLGRFDVLYGISGNGGGGVEGEGEEDVFLVFWGGWNWG